jgi:hypothetical protein
MTDSQAIGFTRTVNYFGYGAGELGDQDIDEIKFWNRELTVAEVEADYGIASLSSQL